MHPFRFRLQRPKLFPLLAVAVAMAALDAPAATSTGGSYLARAGNPEAAIVVGESPGASDRHMAEELQRYVRLLSGAELPIVAPAAAPAGKRLIVVGGPASNPLSADAARRGLCRFEGLKAEGFIIKSVDLDGRPVLIVGGNDDAGTMYGIYDLVERLGVVFQLSGDVIPERKPDLAMPDADVRSEPFLAHRGLLAEHGFGSWYMGIQDYDRLLDQMAKMKFNTLHFLWGMGSEFLRFSYKGKVGEIINTPESGYTAWGRNTRSWGVSPHSTTGTADDVRVGRSVFPDRYIGAPEFAGVRTQEEAFAAGREFVRAVIRHAHLRHIAVALMNSELSFVPPNLVDQESRGFSHGDEYMFQRFSGVALSPADPATLDIWEAAMEAMIKTYPDADAYGFWTTEHSPEMKDPRIQAILHENAALRAKLPSVAEIRKRGNVIVGGAMNAAESQQLDADFLQVYLAAKLVDRVKRHHPQTQLMVMTLFRGYKLPILDEMLPKDVWLGNLEECATTKSVMDFYSGMPGRELFVFPRVSDDGDEFHMQLNATEFHEDEIFAGAAKYGLTGMVGQLLHVRNSEYNARYLAEGGWNSAIEPRSFYKTYLGKLYGREALDPLLKAFLDLEENEKAMVYWGRSEIFMMFKDFSPLADLRTNVDYRSGEPAVISSGAERVNAAADERQANGGRKKLERDELIRSINATWGDGRFWKWRQAIAPQHAEDIRKTEGEFYRSRADALRGALALLLDAREKVLPGSRAELEYVIYKTEQFAAYLDVLTACYDARVSLDRAWLGLVDKDRAEFRIRLRQCSDDLERADRLAREVAGRMIAYADVPTERYLLMRFNRNVIAGIEAGADYVAGVHHFFDDRPLARSPQISAQ